MPFIYSDYRELLALDEIDIIDICTPNVLHSEVSIAALKADKHVFCEKPDAVNPEEAQKMEDAAAKSGKVLMVMRNNRFNPASQFMKICRWGTYGRNLYRKMRMDPPPRHSRQGRLVHHQGIVWGRTVNRPGRPFY